MPVRYYSMIITAYLLLLVLGTIWDQSIAASDFSDLNTVMQFQLINLNEASFFFTEFQFPTINFDWFGALINIIMLDFTFFYGNYNLVRYLLLALLGAPMAFLFITRVAPAIASFVAGFNPLR